MRILLLALVGALVLTPLIADAKAKSKAKSNKARASTVRNDAAADLVIYGRRADVMRFADDVAQQRGFDPAWVEDQLSRARFVPTVARLIMPPVAGTAKNWAAYRARFIEPQRVRAGAAFWEANRNWLAAAED